MKLRDLRISRLRRQRERDWRKPEDYADIAGLKGRELAWEFLRRNPAYCAAYECWAEREGAGHHEKADELFSDICHNFGIAPTSGPESPISDCAPLFAVEDVPSGPEFICYWHDGRPAFKCTEGPPISRLCMEVRIVGERPFNEQMAQLHKMYERMLRVDQREQGPGETANIRRQDSLYGTYLRVLDGRKAVSNSEVARVLYPNLDGRTAQGRVTKHLKAAKAISDNGYLDIVAAPFRR